MKQLEAISAYFGLGPVLAQQRLGGHANANYLVTTDQGEFVFKILLNHPLEDLQQELIYLQRLEDYAYPAAYYLPSTDGPFFYQKDEMLAVVQRKSAGHIPERSPAINQELGSYLAQLHLIPTHELPKKWSWMHANYLLDSFNTARCLNGEQEIGPFLQAYEQVRHFQPALLPQSIIHGDATLYNCLFVGEKLSVLLDWEEVTIGASLLDLAMTALMFCFVQRVFQFPLLTSLLDGYMQVRPLTQKEHEQLETAIKYAGLMISTYFLLQSLEHRSPENPKDLQEFYWNYKLDSWIM